MTLCRALKYVYHSFSSSRGGFANLRVHIQLMRIVIFNILLSLTWLKSVNLQIVNHVTDAPTCRHDKVVVIGASRSESLEIVCEVDADPPADSFRWKFNNSGETLDVGPERFSSNGSVSVLKYTPVADLDYGTLSCWAQNSIGLQVMPCVFQLIAAGKLMEKSL